MEKKTVRFTETSKLQRGGGKPDIVYESGKVYQLRADRANRWTRRGVAVEVAADEAKKAADKPLEIPVAEYDRVATDVAVGLYEIGYAVPQMATHYRVDEKEIRAELEPRIAKIKAASAKGAADGNAVGSSANVGGQDGGHSGVGAEHVAGRGRGGARGGRSGGGGQSNA